MIQWPEKKVPAPIPEAVKIAAIDAMASEAPSVGSHLKGVHRTNAMARAALRKAAHYAARAGVDEAVLIEYLKGRLQ